jgi:hypothetical protein
MIGVIVDVLVLIVLGIGRAGGEVAIGLRPGAARGAEEQCQTNQPEGDPRHDRIPFPVVFV